MNGDPLRELLQSPLDDLPARRRPRTGILPAFLVAAALGGGAGWAVAAALDSGPGQTAVVTTAGPAITSTTRAGASDAVLWETAGSFEQNGSTYLVAATVVQPDRVATRVEAPWTVRWALRIDDTRTVDYLGEHRSPVVPGVFTIRFPDVDLARGAELLAYPVEDESEGALQITLDTVEFPWSGTLEQDRFGTGGATIVVDTILLDDGGGQIGWHVEGDPWARGWVTAEMEYLETGSGSRERSVSADFSGGDGRPEAPRAAPEREGAIELYHLDGTVLGGDPDVQVAVTDLELRLTATVYFYAAEPVSIDVPAAGGR